MELFVTPVGVFSAGKFGCGMVYLGTLMSVSICRGVSEDGPALFGGAKQWDKRQK